MLESQRYEHTDSLFERGAAIVEVTFLITLVDEVWGGGGSFRFCLETASGAHPASYLVVTRGAFTGGNADGI
jgi:hypothetical protein